MDPKFGMEDLGNDKVEETIEQPQIIEKSNESAYMTKEHQLNMTKPEEQRKVL